MNKKSRRKVRVPISRASWPKMKLEASRRPATPFQAKELRGTKGTKAVRTASERKLEKTLSKLKMLAPPNQLVVVHNYLRAVYKTGRKMRLTGDKDAQASLLKLVPHMRMKGKLNRFRILIELTAGPSTSSKQRGRYGRALQALHAKKVQSADFIASLKAAGGVNKLGDRRPQKGEDWRDS